MKCKLCPPYFATLAQPRSFFAIWSPHSSVSRRPAHVIPLILFQCRPQHWSGVRDRSACHIWSDNPFLAKGLSHLQHHPNIKGNPAQERVTRECSASGRTPRISWRRFFFLSLKKLSPLNHHEFGQKLPVLVSRAVNFYPQVARPGVDFLRWALPCDVRSYHHRYFSTK